MDKNEIVISEHTMDMDELYKNSIDLINYARTLVSNQVNIIQLMTYYSLGKRISFKTIYRRKYHCYGRCIALQ